jgi:hypothetical protein
MPKSKVAALMRKPEASELEYFKKNPTVAGMATEDNRVIINPYSTLSKKEKDAVALNEAARVQMRTTPDLKPDFSLTEEQVSFLNSNTYKDAPEEDRKATIAARILSGDPSAGTPTEEQQQFVNRLKQTVTDETATKMAKGGQVKSQTKRMLEQGGMLQEGGTVDKVSGNKVPVGAMKEEVRDDIPAQLSEGEFVFPADVVRYIGLERLMMMRQAAKAGLGKMEDMGQMSNGEEGTEEEDTAEFESQIDDIMGEMDSEGKSEAVMAVGGMVQQTNDALAQGQQPATEPATPKLTPEQLAMIQETAQKMQGQQGIVEGLPSSRPTEGLNASDIIKSNFSPEQQQDAENFLVKVDRLAKAKRLLIIRHNDTVVTGFVKRAGVIDPYLFTQDTPEKLNESIQTSLDIAKKSGITRLESDSKANVQMLTDLGYPVQESETGWSLDLQ